MRSLPTLRPRPGAAPGLRALLTAAAVALPVALAGAHARAQTLRDISPNNSTLHAANSNGASGGRVNGLAAAPNSDRVFYAASEWGGLYKSTDGGRNWSRLSAHLPTVTWDVEVSPADANRVYAASFYDGRATSLAGINVSSDGGSTWTHPAPLPAPGFCLDPDRRAEPSAFGISVDPDNPRNVYVGTNCGLAVSNDAGATWRYVDPTPNDPADTVWDVVVHHGGIIDTCGDDGHRRSTNGGATWTGATGPRPLGSGMCSIAASPDEPYVLFAVSGTTISESDDGGANWSTQFANPGSSGRIPFVATNQRTGRAFDLWFGDFSLSRAGCMTPAAPAPGGSPRCPPSSSWATNLTSGAHADTGTLLFDPRPGADPCPLLYSSDGGVYFNTVTASPGCQTPRWDQPSVTPHGLWLFAMAGADRAGVDGEDLYFGLQDNGSFATTAAGASAPAWANRDCCDGFDDAADGSQVVYTICCYSPPPGNRLFVRNPGMTGGAEVSNYPAGTIPGFRAPDVLDRFGPGDYVLVTTSGVFVTTNVAANPVSWTQLGAASTPVGACAVEASGSGAAQTFYVQAGSCGGGQGAIGRGWGGDALWKYSGTSSGGTWQRVRPPGGAGGFGVVTAHPTDPNRLFASHITAAGARMILSTDGGANWNPLPALDALMTGGGTYRNFNAIGPTNFTGFGGYTQPTLVAFDPTNRNVLVAGGADSGVFYSTDGGTNWLVITDNSGGAANPHVPRPRFAYFDHENGQFNLYLGTQGRGVWRARLPSTDVRFRVPELCPEPCRWDVVDPRTGGYVTFEQLRNPDYCPICFVYLIEGGVVRHVEVNEAGMVKGVVLDSGKLRAFDMNGKEMPLGIPVLRLPPLNRKPQSCPGCAKALEGGAVVRGLVVERGRLRGVVIDRGKERQ